MLSCYTTNLLGHLRRDLPDIDTIFAEAVELSVRVDRLDGLLAFSQHRRVDPGLGYRGADSWERAATELTEEFERYGDVLVVGSTRNLPWCPAYGAQDVPHWFRLVDRRGADWTVLDEFDALLPYGTQRPWRGWVTGDQLRQLIAPLPPLSRELRLRDVHALGEPLRVPPPGMYRWLSRRGDSVALPGGQWVRGTVAVLRLVAERFAEDAAALSRHTEDLWAAGRHHQFRFAHDERVVAAWGELTRALRFAAQSAARGKARPSLVMRAFEEVISVTATQEVTR
jgi:hypothetical protein